MRDWQAFVKSHLHLARVRPARESRLIAEAAAQLEDLYRDAVLRGASHEEADTLARQHVTDWKRLADDLAAADRTARVPAMEQRLQAAVERRSRLRSAWTALAAIHQDLRHAARLLARRPGVASVLVLTLALGIGANSAIFGAVDAVLLRALPYDQPERLVNLFEDNLIRGDSHWVISVPNWYDWRQQARVFDGSAAYHYQSATLTGESEARRLLSVRIWVGAFGLLGVAPAIGRDFVPDDAGGGRDVAILSSGLWQQLFAADPGAIGRTVRLDGRPHTVVGVMPATFRFPSPEVDLWRPMSSDVPLVNRGRHFAHAIARLKAGVTLD